jgi:hypothetical protein
MSAAATAPSSFPVRLEAMKTLVLRTKWCSMVTALDGLETAMVPWRNRWSVQLRQPDVPAVGRAYSQESHRGAY